MNREHLSGFVAIAFGGCAMAATLLPVASADARPSSHPAASAAAAVQMLHARLRGGSSGDPDGRGHADFKLNRSKGKVCATVTWSNIGTPTEAHIHRVSDSTVAVDLTGSVTGGVHCTHGVAAGLIRKIERHPGHFYFNVHNNTYPAGAISGKLKR
ncbi:MAG: hypothetical protein QOJ68_2390 [Blastococcus sp.]|jgi:hypothetical protein|nr:hypothetical protein [Blastococcus sp.]